MFNSSQWKHNLICQHININPVAVCGGGVETGGGATLITNVGLKIVLALFMVSGGKMAGNLAWPERLEVVRVSLVRVTVGGGDHCGTSKPGSMVSVGGGSASLQGLEG